MRLTPRTKDFASDATYTPEQLAAMTSDERQSIIRRLRREIEESLSKSPICVPDPGQFFQN